MFHCRASGRTLKYCVLPDFFVYGNFLPGIKHILDRLPGRREDALAVWKGIVFFNDK